MPLVTLLLELSAGVPAACHWTALTPTVPALPTPTATSTFVHCCYSSGTKCPLTSWVTDRVDRRRVLQAWWVRRNCVRCENFTRYWSDVEFVECYVYFSMMVLSLLTLYNSYQSLQTENRAVSRLNNRMSVLSGHIRRRCAAEHRLPHRHRKQRLRWRWWERRWHWWWEQRAAYTREARAHKQGSGIPSNSGGHHAGRKLRVLWHASHLRSGLA